MGTAARRFDLLPYYLRAVYRLRAPERRGPVIQRSPLAGYAVAPVPAGAGGAVAQVLDRGLHAVGRIAVKGREVLRNVAGQAHLGSLPWVLWRGLSGRAKEGEDLGSLRAEAQLVLAGGKLGALQVWR